MEHAFKKLFLLVITSLLLFSCHDDFEEQLIVDETRINPITEFVESNIRGTVASKDGEPIEAAEVKLDGQIIYTDSDGFFRFDKINSISNGDLISIKKQDFISNYKIVYPELNSSLNLDIILNPRQLTAKHNSDQIGSFEIVGGGNISFPANAIQNDKGEIYNGSVNVYSYWIDAESPYINYEMPGDLSGVNIEGQNVQLASFGMMSVELEDESGNPLNMAEGFTSTLRFPLSNSQLNNAPDEIPLWYFDEETGKWKEEGKAIKQGDYYIGEVSHFSFWNCDAPFEVIEIAGKVIDVDGYPVQGWPVTIFIGEGPVAGTGYTNSNGLFRGKVPANEVLRLVIENCDNIVLEEEIGPFSNDVDLGSFTLIGNDVVLSGNVITCSPDQNDEVYAIATVDGQSKTSLVAVDTDGNFKVHLKYCNANEATIQFVNPNDFSFSTTENVLFVNKEANISDVQLCGGDGSYISFKSDNESFVVPILEGGFYKILNEERYEFKTNFELNGLKTVIDISVESLDLGIYDDSEVVFSYASNPYNIASFWNTANVEIEVLNAGNTNEYFVASFKGIEDVTTGKQFSGVIRIKVLEAFNTGTISGRTWIDENLDGIHSIDENNFITFYNLAAIKDTNDIALTQTPQNLILSGSAFIEDDGTYIFTGLYPNRKYHIIQNTIVFDTDPTLLNTGSDSSLDNDFFLAIDDRYISTNAIFVNDGEVIENIDLGVVKPNSFIIETSFTPPCLDSVRIGFKISGGEPPFNFELSTGESYTGGATFTLNITNPGLFTLEITDAMGVTASLDIDPKISDNVIRGNIWLDSDTGTIDSYDDIEPLQAGIEVGLYDEDGLCETAVTTIFGFQFEHVPRGYSYIKVELPAGHSFVMQGVGAFPSEVDSNGESMSFEFTGCNEKQDILIGIKKN